MGAGITFTDATGTATLSNGKPVPADRFDAWAPRSTDVGDKAHAMADGARYSYAFREEHRVRFTLSKIPNTSMATMLRLGLHLDRGGQVTVTTADSASRSYTCALAPDAEVPEPELTDPAALEYSMAFDLIGIGADAETPLVCTYW